MVEILSEALRFDLTKGELRLLLALAAAAGAIEPCSNAALAQAAGMDRSYVRRARQGLLSKGLVEMQGSRLQIPGCEAMTPLEGGQGVPSGGDRASPGGDRLSPEVGTGRPQGGTGCPQKWGQDVPRGDRVSPPSEQSSTWKEETFTEKGNQGERSSSYLPIFPPPEKISEEEEELRVRRGKDRKIEDVCKKILKLWNELIDALPQGVEGRPVRHRSVSDDLLRAVYRRMRDGYDAAGFEEAIRRYVETVASPQMFSPGFGRWRLDQVLTGRSRLGEDYFESLLQEDWHERFGGRPDFSTVPPTSLRRAEWTQPQPTQLSLGLDEEIEGEVAGPGESLFNGLLESWSKRFPIDKPLTVFEAQDVAMRLEDEFGAEATAKLPEVLDRIQARSAEAGIPPKRILKMTMRDETFAALIARKPAGLNKVEQLDQELRERTRRLAEERRRRKGR